MIVRITVEDGQQPRRVRAGLERNDIARGNIERLISAVIGVQDADRLFDQVRDLQLVVFDDQHVGPG